MEKHLVAARQEAAGYAEAYPCGMVEEAVAELGEADLAPVPRPLVGPAKVVEPPVVGEAPRGHVRARPGLVLYPRRARVH